MVHHTCLVLLLVAAAYAAPDHKIDPADECGECDPRRCRQPLDCVAGQVLDKCECCMTCAQGEGQRCSDPSLKLKYGNKYGPCGNDLVCVIRDDLKSEEEPEALCVCNQQQMACASDGKSYDTICQLREEISRGGQGDLRMLHWGHCRSAPWIVSAPEPWSGPEHHRLALDCEAKGYPAPEVHWELIDTEGTSMVLPADRSRCAVQLRGGPENHMVTSWLQLLDLGPEDMGNYSCVATNSEGQARAGANVHVFH